MNAILLSVGAIVLAKLLDRSSPRAGDSVAPEYSGGASLSGLFRSSGGENIPSGGGTTSPPFTGKYDAPMVTATSSPVRNQAFKSADVGALSPIVQRIGGTHLDPAPRTDWRMVS